MGLTEAELTDARAVIARALDEDLRYGPDVTTMATVPADASTTASIVTREPGVFAGSDVALRKTGADTAATVVVCGAGMVTPSRDDTR